MKRINYLAIAVITVLAIGCQKESDKKDTEVVDAISIGSTEIVLPSKGGETTISFNATGDWTATSDAEWLTVKPESGKAGDNVATIAATANDDENFEDRSAGIEFVCGKAKTTVKVQQLSHTVYGAAIDKNIDYTAQSIVIYTETNSENATVEISEDCADWISLAESRKSAPVEGFITLNISENTGFRSRQGCVTIGDPSCGMFAVTINQASFAIETEAVSAAFLGRSQRVYDDAVNWALSKTSQYALQFATSENGNLLTLVINVDRESCIPTLIPTGNFAFDYAVEYTPGTFAVNDPNLDVALFTSVTDGEGQTPYQIGDGEITIEENDGVYTIVATLLDEKDNTHIFGYEGTLPVIEDKSLGIQIYDASYKKNYNTYFTSNCNEWNLNTYISELLPGLEDYIYNISFNIFAAGGTVAPSTIPAGVYTFTTEETIDSPYKNGIQNVSAGQFTSSYGNANFVPAVSEDEYDSYDYVDITGGTIEITDNDGKIGLKYDLTLKIWNYDEDYNPVVIKENIPFQLEDELVTPGPVSDNQIDPMPDTDYEFTALPSYANYYQALWYGDSYSLGWNVFALYFSNMNSNYTMYCPIMSDATYTYARTAAIPAGTYTFSTTKVANCICNLDGTSRKCITNSYTGTTCVIDGGTITVSADKVVFDLTATTATTGIEVKQLHFTGTLNAPCAATTNYSAASRQSQVTWTDPAPIETTKITLSESMISSNDPMQYVCGGDGTGDYGLAFNPDWFNPINPEQVSARQARFGQAANMWDNDASTCYHLNLDWGEPYTSWGVRSYDINDNRNEKRYIQVTFNEPYRLVDLKWQNSDQGRLAEAYEIHTSTDGSNFSSFKTGISTGNWGENVEVTGIDAGSMKAVRIANSRGDADWTFIVSSFGIAELEVKAAK